jgi:hypothetical protein
MKYNLDVEIKSAQGTQEFRIEANSKEEAIEKFKKGECELIDSDVEVTALEEPDISAIYEILTQG